MPTRPEAPRENRASPVMIAVGVVALLLFLGWMAYRNFGPPPHPRIPENVHTPIADWVRAKARESGGDINKLNPEDQMKLQNVTQGKGVAYLKRYAHSTD